jgi:hypothetical protein
MDGNSKAIYSNSSSASLWTLSFYSGVLKGNTAVKWRVAADSEREEI